MRKRIVYDKSVYGATRAGVYVFAKGILQALTDENSIDLVEFNNPFSTIGKSGLRRKFSSLFRLLYCELIFTFYKKRALFLFPAPEMSVFVALFKLDFVITIHDLFTWKNTDKTTFFAKFRQRLLPFYARRAKFVLTVSEFSKREIVELFDIDPNKIVVCYNGLSKEYLKNDVIGPEVAVNSHSPFILFVGSSEPRKNLPFLIEVFDELNGLRSLSKQRLVTLIMTCSESWGNEALGKRIFDSPYKDLIVTTGHVSDEYKIDLYRSSSATILPSLAEGFGIPVIESLSLGTPVFVQDNTALSMFSEYGAVVMDNFDSKSWAFQINNVITNGERVKQCFVDEVATTFSWSRSAHTILEKLK